ncbi:MAG: type I DNA topoisomerase [Patescibacteria group bacterium]|nr:type I DNA topoisomerase [Patescibacteria group bacterium]MDE2438416.1 type I DNA topoisomerase [Patescibacteria group bacterium]
MKLVIVESPTKAKTITGFLGKDYDIESSYGHVRDLPKSAIGIDIEHNFEPKYVIPRKAAPQVKKLRALAKKADEIILATDEDREGEAIAWHLSKALGLEGESPNASKKVERIVFHEITKTAINEALTHPRSVNLDVVNAQQARRILDRLVGYKLSPFLWKKISKGLSAGRVQSVALKLVVDREKEIEAFTAEEYWTISALLKKGSDEFSAELSKKDGMVLDKRAIPTKKEAQEIESDLQHASYTVSDALHKETFRQPPVPFITSTLQQESSKKLHLSAKQTMMLAQQLYEGVDLGGGQVGLITYMRTDSTNIAEEALHATKQFIHTTYGAEYALEAPRRFKSKSKLAQEAHEAIRPTDVTRTPELVANYLTPQQRKLYHLIWARFVASQMPRAKFSLTSIQITAQNSHDYTFKTNGSSMLFDGFLKAWPIKYEERLLPSLLEQDSLSLIKIDSSQHFTEPPPRFNEASLIKILEENGVGRPATYASTLSVLEERNYVDKNEDRRFRPTEIGRMVSDLLSEHFPEIVDIGFTAKMEDDLDGVAEGNTKWVELLREFYTPFSAHLEQKYTEVKSQKVVEETDEICDKCGKKMWIRRSRFGRFLGCSGFPECKNTRPLPASLSTTEEKGDLPELPCPTCHEGKIVMRRTKKRRIFYGCSRYPDCNYATWTRPTTPAENTPETVKEEQRGEEK